MISGEVDSADPQEQAQDNSEASCEQIAQEQKEDETLSECFKLAKQNKGGFIFLDGLLYHMKVILG